MAQATVTFDLGAETVTSVLEIDLVSGETILTGDIDAVVVAGTTARLTGNCRLLNNLHVRGTLKSDPTFVLDGQGLWDIHTHDGGVLDLAGTEKTAWCRWGDSPVGWEIGDRLAVSPTALGVFVPSETTWTGSWSSMVRPANSPDFTLMAPDSRVMKPEVVNLSQTAVIKNVTRVMMHEAEGQPNVHTLKWLKVLNSGKTNELTFYPIHFHFLGDTCRGSLVEGVVVEGGKNHAFVPHASHGITFRDVVAYRTTDFAYWWDFPPTSGNTVNDSHDVIYQHVLGMDVRAQAGDPGYRLAAFVIAAGVGNKVTDSVMTCTQGSVDASGFNWPEKSVSSFWLFEDNVSHNNKIDAIFTWQNGGPLHVIDRFVAYRNGGAGIDHGAYVNWYHYKNCVLMGNAEAAFKLHARDSVQLHDIVADGPLWLMKQQNNASTFCVVRRCSFTLMNYQESGANKASKIRYQDCGFVPANFAMAYANPASIAEIWEGGVLMHRWTQGVWT